MTAGDSEIVIHLNEDGSGGVRVKQHGQAVHSFNLARRQGFDDSLPKDPPVEVDVRHAG